MGKSSAFERHVSSFFSERSPLYTTLLISWSASNWRFFYVTFVISSDDIPKCYATKMHYAASFFDLCTLFVYPAVATAIIIWGLPWIGLYAYQASLDFRKRRRERRLRDDKSRAYTYEEVESKVQGYRERADSLEDDYSKSERIRKILGEELQQLKSANKTFKILTAKFGAYSTTWNDVLNDLKDLESGKTSVMVTPNAFSTPDPYLTALKQLVICYQDTDGQIHFISATEGDTVRRVENRFVVDLGDAGKHEGKKADDIRRDWESKIR